MIFIFLFLQTFHVGGDEVPQGPWLSSPVCSRLRESGVTLDLKTYLVSQLANMTSLYNIDLAIWEDGVMSGDTPMERGPLPNRSVNLSRDVRFASKVGEISRLLSQTWHPWDNLSGVG